VSSDADVVQAVGADGFPLIVASRHSYSDSNRTGQGIWVIHCLEVDCSTSEVNQIYTPRTFESNFPGRPSLAIGSYGMPLIVFEDANLYLVACQDVSCRYTTLASRQILVAQTALSTQGVRPSSIVIGSDGNPLVAYVTNLGSPRVLHCTNANCLTGTPVITVLSDPASRTSFANAVDISVAIGTDGLGVIALGGYSLRAAHCSNLDCSSMTTVGSGTAPTVGLYCSAVCGGGSATSTIDSVFTAIGADGMLVIGGRSDDQFTASYPPAGTRQPFIVHCSTLTCDASASMAVESASGADLGAYSWLTIGQNGHALITYRDGTNSRLRAAYCADLACTTFSLTTTDANPTEFSSVVTGIDGMPLVVAANATTHKVKAFHCSNIFCVPYARNR
jgi:hypothetical protein